MCHRTAFHVGGALLGIAEEPDIELSCLHEGVCPEILPAQMYGNVLLESNLSSGDDVSLPSLHDGPEQKIAELNGSSRVRVACGYLRDRSRAYAQFHEGYRPNKGPV